MPFSKAGQLARTVTTARLSDPIGLVAENLREAPHGVLPVLDRTILGDQSDRNARVIGLITQQDLSKVTQTLMGVNTPAPVVQAVIPPRPFSSEDNELSNEQQPAVAIENILETTPPHLNGSSPHLNSSNGSGPPNIKTLRAGDVMRGDVPIIPAAFSLHNALLTLERYDFSALPVIDGTGRYMGLISRADVVSAIAGTIRPPLVGGMATPFGVYLTDGRLSGGVAPLALFFTGLILSICLTAAQLLLALAAGLINPAWGAMSLSGRISELSDGTGLFNLLITVGQSLLLFAAIRMLPLSGYHAAEHQTVHALERGLPLEIEFVEKMPRAHPRCGTNLAILGSLMLIGFQHLPGYGPEYILPILIFTFFFWRAFGTFVQEFFTTRPATKKQLQSGIDAANELMRKYQAEPFATPSMPLRLLNNGMIPVAGGMLLGYGVMMTALEYLSRFILR